MLNLGDVFPNAKLPTTFGELDLYEFFGDSWAMLFSHPKDFTPVCTTEISRMAQLDKEFTKRNVKCIGLSVDSVNDHQEWLKDVSNYSGCVIKFPLIADDKGEFAASIGMLMKSATDTLTCRGVFIISPDKRVRAIICYPASTGRNFDEILRVIDSLQLTDSRKDIVTPVDWKVGDEVIVKPGCEAPAGSRVVDLPSKKEYLRFTK